MMSTGRGRVRRRRRGGVILALRRRRYREPLRERARRSAGRLAAALAVLLFTPALSVPLLAQPAGPNQLASCLDTNRPAAFQSGGDLAPDGPPREGGLIAPNSLVVAALGCAEDFANTTMVPIGLNLLRGLAVIITIWTGIQMMFGGGFAIGEVVSLALLIGFPLSVLSWYAATVATPWGNFSFVTMVSGMGRAVGENLVTGVFASLSDTVVATWDRIWGASAMVGLVNASEPFLVRFWRGATTFDGGLGELVRFFRNALRSLQLSFMVFLVFGLLVIPAVVAYCSYLWAYLSLAVATILGPLLIPWILVPQLQFLAWGWFRAVLGAGVHMMVAGACFAVAAQLLMIPLVRFGTLAVGAAEAGVLADSAFTVFGPMAALVESAPLILVAYLGVFKIGEITAMIMNGGSMPSSGLGDRISSMQTMGRLRGSLARGGGAAAGGLGGGGAAGRAALAATGAGAAAVAAGAVLSQATKSRA